MTLSDIQILYDFNYWAKARIMSVIEALGQEQFTKNLGSSHGGIHGTLVHVVGAEHIWLSRWIGKPVNKLLDAKDYLAIAAIRQKWDEVEQDMGDFVSNLTEENLSATVTYRTTEGKELSNPLWEMMQSRRWWDEPFHISPRADCNNVAPTRRKTNRNRPHYILSGATCIAQGREWALHREPRSSIELPSCGRTFP